MVGLMFFISFGREELSTVGKGPPHLLDVVASFGMAIDYLTGINPSLIAITAASVRWLAFSLVKIPLT